MIPNFGPDATPEWLRDWALRIESAGYEAAMVADHVPTTQDVHVKYGAPFYEPLTTLAWLAAATSRIELGTSALITPHRHPVMLARMAANVDQFSGGRLILGFAIGWSEQEYATLGLPFRQRGRMTEEFLEALATMWDGTDELVHYSGRYVSFRDVHRKPVPLRRPPIWIGANAISAIRRTVRRGDAWHPVVWDLDWLENEGMPSLRKEAADHGRPVPQLAARVKVFLHDTALRDQDRRCGEGSAEQIGDDLRRLARIGADYIILDTDDPRVRHESRSIDEHWEVLDGVADVVAQLRGSVRAAPGGTR
jgi:probable F420-dependent oxidoreductase